MKAENNRVVTSFAVSPKMLMQLQEHKKENGVSISWLINKLLSEYFTKAGGDNNGR